MSGLWLVAWREIVTRGRTKGFIAGLVVSAVLVGAFAFLPKVFDGPDSYTVGVVGSSALQPALTGAAGETEVTTRPFADEAAARQAVLDGDVDAAVVDDRRVLADGEVDRELGALLESAHRTVQTQKQLTDAGLDPAKVGQAMQVAPLEQVSVGADTRYAAARTGIATIVVFVLFFLIFQSAMFVAMGVVEEKGSRIVEILLTSIRPWQLLGGKVLGLGVLALANLVVIMVVGLGAAAATGFAVDLPPGMAGIVLGTLFWFLLGYAFFSVMAAALSSLVSRQEEVSSVLTPLQMLIMVSYFAAFFATMDPGTTLARVMSLVPPFSSMVMPVRMAGGEVPLWEIGLAAALMLVATAGMLAVGARIYERAVLRTGARVKLAEVVRRPASVR
ncbi:ABC transporter permease [Planomonospora parontospora]|uniref:ABC transporter permease n=1 Tax=Planomonospora parontospora TaxID=58119 RepID=UPI00167039CA|nr:ABC transporter permease [Planomonospora parontospora]GGL36067.1 ABC transporter permease [Planomonospora parontospora subsp. antibiotica]GII17414.1 ABC transporter permease [Planomonospora parontospora subsp. antibiotica]